MAFADMNIKVGADIADALTKINQLKQANIGLAEETKTLSAEYNKNAKALRALEEQMQKGIGVTAQSQKRMDDLRKTQQLLSTSIVDNKNVLKQSTTTINAFEKAQTAATKATGGLAGGLKGVYSGLSKIANIIPGLGIGTLVGLIAGPLIEAFADWVKAANDVGNANKLISDSLDASSSKYAEAVETVSALRLEIQLAKDGFISKEGVVKHYNETIGKTTGLVKTLDEAEQALNKNAEAYIKFTFLKAVATEANALAAKKAVEAQLALLKPQTEFAGQGDAFLQASKEAFINPLNSFTDLLGNAGARMVKVSADNRKKFVDAANSDKTALNAIAADFNAQAAALSKLFNFNFFQDTKELKAPKGIKEHVKKIKERYVEELRNIAIPLDDIFKESQGKVSAIKRIFPTDEIIKAGIALDELNRKLQEAGEFATSVLTPAFDALFSSIVEGSGNALQSFGEALNQIIKRLVVTLLKAIALGAVLALIKGTPFNIGTIISGAIKGFAKGGHVKGGGSGTSDSIPARLSAGEYVMKASTVKQFGVDFFDKLNKGGSPNFFSGIPKFAMGGFVSPGLGSIGGGQEIRIVGEFKLRNDHLVAAVTRGNAQIRRNG